MLVLADAAATRTIAASPQPHQSAAIQQDLEPRARAVCGSCHAYPPPDILPRDNWRDEFVRMMFIREGRHAAHRPARHRQSQRAAAAGHGAGAAVLCESRARNVCPPPDAWPQPAGTPLSFTRRAMAVPGMSGTPAVSHVRLVDLDGDGQLDVLGTDMRQGLVFSGNPGAAGGDAGGDREHSRTRPTSRSPTSTRTASRISSSPRWASSFRPITPRGPRSGCVAWQRASTARSGSTAGRVSPASMRRTSTATARPDLAVAAFGWRKTGQVADARESHQQPVAAVVRHPHDRPARRQHPARSRRSEPRRQDGLRHAARAGARDGPRLHQHGRRRTSRSSARSSMPRRIRTGDRRDSSSSISTRTATSTSS